VQALPVLTAPEVVELFEKYGVFSRRELESRQSIYLEQYCRTIHTEAALVVKMARTQIFPAAVRYQSELAATCANMKAIGMDFVTHTLSDLTEKLRGLQQNTDALDALVNSHFESEIEEAAFMREKVLPAMEKVRSYADQLENIVADDLWPLPSYQEMLFIK
jgi:glutamine synthetase